MVKIRVPRSWQCCPHVAAPCRLNNAGPRSSRGTLVMPLLNFNTGLAASFTMGAEQAAWLGAVPSPAPDSGTVWPADVA